MDFEAEFKFLNAIFDSDAKNYHAWAYRIWLVERFCLYEGEEEYAEHLLEQDVLNNSAWSYRYFLINKKPDSLAGSVPHVLEEVKYIF